MKTNSSEPVDARVLDVLDEYLEGLRAGRAPDRETLLARHPEVAESLAASLRALDFVHEAGRMLESPQAPSGAEESTSAGRTLGDYRLLREIGRGGMAVVYEAEQMSLGRHVALKVLPFAAVLDPKQVQRFKNEAQAAAQLQHPHIVPVHAVGCERGVHFYAMQYVEGQSLAVAIREMRSSAGLGSPDDPRPGSPPAGPRTPISSHPSIREPAYIRMAARLGVQAAVALDHAHQIGIVHRDVKPGNLLVDLTGTLWITDFGLAYSRKDVGLTMTGELLGTFRYMSPEQAHGKPIDHRTDVYSLGATLYELFTLEPAIPGEDPHAVLQAVRSREPVPPRRHNPALPRDLETVLLKAMAKEPGSRYATAQEMADDLGRFLEHRPIEAKRPGPVLRAAKWGRRHRALVGTAIGVMLLTVAGLATGTALLWREQERTRSAFGRAEANFTLALKALDEICLEESEDGAELAPDKLQKALAFYEQFARENAHNTDFAWLVGGAYTRASRIFLALDKEDQAAQALDKAISVCREANGRQPDSARTWVSLGNALWMNGELDEGIKAYGTAIRLQPDYAGAHNNLGIALLKQGKFEEAIRNLRKAMELMPRDANAHNELGMSLLKNREREEAIRRFREAIELKEDFAPAYINLGNALRDDGRRDEAIRMYQKATELQPNSAIGHLSLGDALRGMGKLKDAIHEYRMAIDAQPKSYFAHYSLFFALREDGDLAGASKAYEEAIHLRPRDPLTHLMNAHMLAASGALPVLVPKGQGGPASAAEEAPHVGFFEGSVDDSAFPKVVVHAKGSSAQLGPFTFRMPHDVEPAEGTATGTFELLAANGDNGDNGDNVDKLEGTITGTAGPTKSRNVIHLRETVTITSGTGRFAGATGGFTIERLYNRASKGTSGTFAGTISAPDLGE